jgi:hypothetical protein
MVVVSTVDTPSIKKKSPLDTLAVKPTVVLIVTKVITKKDALCMKLRPGPALDPLRDGARRQCP